MPRRFRRSALWRYWFTSFSSYATRLRGLVWCYELAPNPSISMTKWPDLPASGKENRKYGWNRKEGEMCQRKVLNTTSKQISLLQLGKSDLK